MAQDERLLIYVTGGDSALREICFEMLEDGTASDVDLLEASSLYLAPNGKRKHSAVGRAVVLVVARDRGAPAMARLRRAGSDVHAYALPIVDGL